MTVDHDQADDIHLGSLTIALTLTDTHGELVTTTMDGDLGVMQMLGMLSLARDSILAFNNSDAEQP